MARLREECDESPAVPRARTAADDADWCERGLLDGATRRALVSVNLAFLDLAAELAEEGRLKQIPGLPPRALDSLIGLEAASKLCERLPFALFDLRFADGAFWAAEIIAAGGMQDRLALPAADERIVAFTRAVIMVAWHLAQTRASCARLVFGASPRPSPPSRRCRSHRSTASRDACVSRSVRALARARASGCSSRAALSSPTSARSRCCANSACRFRARTVREARRCSDGFASASLESLSLAVRAVACEARLQ